MRSKPKSRRESPPPSKWVKSKSGTVAQVTTVTKRDHRGRRLYRLRYAEGVRGSQTWTIEELAGWVSRWLKNKPRGWGQA